MLNQLFAAKLLPGMDNEISGRQATPSRAFCS
jgi:hypothetical protein